ncbi:baseplate protein [Pseudomonas phage Dolphis]|nr:baseplate protein [Pseudomonas phage Dolphis]
MGWGNGSPSWDATPVPPNVDSVALLAEIGRLKATTIQFAVPSSAGTIELPEGKFNLSLVPTKYLLLNFEFSYSQAVGQDIREMGVFVGTTAKSGVPSSTIYLTPDQIEDSGRMMVVERVAKFTRQSNTKQKFTYVIQF